MSWTFLHGGRLWLLLVVVGLIGAYVLALVTGRRRAVKFTNIDLLDSILPKQRQWRRHLVTGLLLAGLSVGIFALAQPYREQQVANKRSIIMIALDVSLSMQAEDVDPSRFEAARQQAIEFVESVDDTIEVGLISFSENVKLRVPPTLDREKVTQAIERFDLEEGTAIGDAIIEATDVLVEEFRDSPTTGGPDDTAADSPEDTSPTDDPLGDGDGPPAAIVILTDGETVEGLTPGEVGAESAAAAGIPVFGIVFGTADGTIELEDPVTGQVVTEPVPVKDEELTQAAEITDGQFYKAESTGDLSNVYDDIRDRLEPALKLPEPIRNELTIRYLAVALLLMLIAIALGFWWLGGIS